MHLSLERMEYSSIYVKLGPIAPKSWDWEEPMEEAMLKLIEDLSPDVIGIEANGKVTHEDYQNILIPKAETMMAKGPIKMLYVIGADFTGYELEAL
jgi:hypothetical protein